MITRLLIIKLVNRLALTCSNGIATRLSTRNVWTASHKQLICPAFPWPVISQLTTWRQITLYVIGLFYCHSFVSQVQWKHAPSRRWSFCFKNVSWRFPPEILATEFYSPSADSFDGRHHFLYVIFSAASSLRTNRSSRHIWVLCSPVFLRRNLSSLVPALTLASRD